MHRTNIQLYNDGKTIMLSTHKVTVSTCKVEENVENQRLKKPSMMLIQTEMKLVHPIFYAN